MDWVANGHPLAALICLVGCGVLGWFVPHLIARIPEPEPEPAPEPEPESEPAPESEPEPEPAQEPGPEPASEPEPEHAQSDPDPDPDPDSGPPAHPEADTDVTVTDATAAPLVGAGAVEKVPYVEIARSPGLAVRAGITSALVGAALGASVGLDWILPCLIFLTPVGVALAVVDWRTMLLPTRVIAPSYAVVIALLLVAAGVQRDADALLHAVIGWAIAGGLFWLLWFIYPRGMGYGDVRLSGILGLALGYLGWAELLVGVYAAFLIGGFGGLLLARLRVVQRKRFPFGPFMLVGAVVGVIFGPALVAGLGY